MKVNLPFSAKRLLQQTPVDTARLITLAPPAETALALRVQSPLQFRGKGLSIQIRLVGSQGKEGVWVLAVVFRITGPTLPEREGILHLNPRRENDYALVRLLTLQDRFPLLFCSLQLHAVVFRVASWSVQQRQEVRLLMTHIDQSVGGKRPHETLDHAFSVAREEFQRSYSVSTLLAGSPSAEARVTGPFRGVVLD